MGRLDNIQNPEDSEITVLPPWIPDEPMMDRLDELQRNGAIVTVITNCHKFEFVAEGTFAPVKKMNKAIMWIKGKRVNILYSPLEIYGKMLAIREGKNHYIMECINYLDKVKAVCSREPLQIPL